MSDEDSASNESIDPGKKAIVQAVGLAGGQDAKTPDDGAISEPEGYKDVFSLGARLKSSGRHPVMLFGTTSSGKSTILMSFIASLMHNSEVGIRLGDAIYPAGHAKRAEAHNFAVEFFERKAQDFIHAQQLLPATRLDYPMFIPLDIQRSRDPLPVKFAFLEGKGEWFEPAAQSKGSIFRSFQEEVVDALRHYDGPLSAIFVAPCHGPDDEAGLRRNDIGLSGALSAYEENRPGRDDDSLLFLLTKWDTHADPIRNPMFGHLEGDDVARVLDRQYPDSWRKFQAMPRPLQNHRRFFMQYCAGNLIDAVNRDPPERQRHIFARYPRTLLNWLFGNATRVPVGNGSRTRERILFEEVMSKDRVQVHILERVTNYLFSK